MTNQYLDLLAFFGIGGAHPGGFALTQSILKDVKIKPIDHVLDIGCGTGQTANFLLKRFGCNVTAVDNHALMIEKTKERFKQQDSLITILQDDAQNLHLQDNTFEFIVAESVIAFTDISKTLKELIRVLKKDGSLFMIEMTAERKLTAEIESKACKLYGIKEILSEEQWLLRLKEAGFKQIDILKTPSQLIQTEVTDINQSLEIPMSYYNLWDEHHEFIEEYRDNIGFRAFKCQF